MTYSYNASIIRFGLLRHAPTVWNAEKRIQGRRDSPLTEQGIHVARQWGRALSVFPWDGIVTSSTERALQTARRVNECLQVPLTIMPELREQDWGRWTGKTLKQIRRSEPNALKREIRAGWEFRPPNGESRIQVWNRCRQALADIAVCHSGANVLVVTHEGVIKSMLYRVTGRLFLPEEPVLLRPHHLHWLIWQDGDLRAQVNAVSLTTESEPAF